MLLKLGIVLEMCNYLLSTVLHRTNKLDISNKLNIGLILIFLF